MLFFVPMMWAEQYTLSIQDAKWAEMWSKMKKEPLPEKKRGGVHPYKKSSPTAFLLTSVVQLSSLLFYLPLLFLPLFLPPAKMIVFKLAIISMLGAVATGLSCYSLDRYSKIATIKHQQKFCYSLYFPEVPSAAHGGQSIHPSRAAKMWHVDNKKDCELQKTNAFGDVCEMYVCVCYSSMCNFPFSFEEFESRNFTISPNYSKLVNGAVL
ncbi:hypothetical protein B9Z55_026557 [Caenorhabditis nigoni]|uniref:Uncharacterized protein n=1 Tax=Caenorhabditis nigoni TaxID=1611254 RepID=A0A2G5T477_9PELO|nr:hypothetical protein B9Z55_026557 [Caenorhabditis nigoni]